jgi:hypothetical protein
MSDRNIWHLIRDFHSQRNPAIVAQNIKKCGIILLVSCGVRRTYFIAIFRLIRL